MAKINYGFEKRQRELAKQKKQEAKEAKRREARLAKSEAVRDAPAEDAPPGGDEAPAAAADATARVHLRSRPG